jgi:UDP-N-acetylglucosamine 2-epimerase
LSKRRVCYLSGTRADFGLMAPLFAHLGRDRDMPITH